jgi:hypothetical protein
MSIPWWEDSQWYIHKTDLQCPILILICTYHCERIHSGIPSNLRQIWQRIARSDAGEMKNRRKKSRYMLHVTCYMLHGLLLLIYTYYCERIHSGISWNPRQIWQRIARFRRWGDESWKSMLLIVLYNTDLYIPLWEDSQWYISMYIISNIVLLTKHSIKPKTCNFAVLT